MKIAAIGTSLTDAAYNLGRFGSPAWFEQTGSWLQSRYPGKVTLSNRAVGASASAYNDHYKYPGAKDGFTQLAEVLDNDSPDAIFIEFAINDADINYYISQADSKANLQTMINTIRTWETANDKVVDIVVLTMNDCSGVYESNRPNLTSYYQGYKEVAEANASNHMLFIDNYPNWKNLHDTNLPQWNSYITDGTHPTPTGATNVILPEVKSSLLNQVVPEPSTLMLLAMGGLFLAGIRLRKKTH